MVEHSVIGVYKTLGEAGTALLYLSAGGFPIQKVSIIAKHLQDERRHHAYVVACGVAKWPAVTGAWVGGIFGMLGGAAFLWVPGVGPLVVVGFLASVLLGGIEGALAGAAVNGVLGWLSSLGISKEKIFKYEEAVKDGKFLVIAQGTADAVKRAHEILASSQAEHLDLHAPVTA